MSTGIEDYHLLGIHFFVIQNKNRSYNKDQIWKMIFDSNEFFRPRKINLPLQILKYKIIVSAKFFYAIHFYIVFHITKPNIGLLLFKMPMRYQGRLG